MSEFKAGDVVVHKTMPDVRWVVDGADGDGVSVRMVRMNGLRLDACETDFGPHELEKVLPPCCDRPGELAGPCFAAENGRYDEWDAEDWERAGEPVFDTDMNTAEDDDPFEMDPDDRPDSDDEDDDEDFLYEVSTSCCLQLAAERLRRDGFLKLAGAVDAIRHKYERGDDCGQAAV